MEPTGEVFGYSTLGPKEILSAARGGQRIQDIPGDWTAVVKERPGRSIVCSGTVAARPCYLAFGADGSPHFSENVFDAARAAGKSWSWNARAIQSLALLGHTVGEDSLHPEVYRLPPDAVSVAEGGRLQSVAGGFWRSLPQRHTAAQALHALRAAFERDAGGAQPLLSLSAGYDSRLLLALCLASGRRPRCVTMGKAESTDVQVAALLCRRQGLEHQRIELRPEEFVRHGKEITKLTSGTKLAANWHTYLYAHAARQRPDEIHLVGSNGEQARHYYLPAHLPARVYEVLPGALFRAYWFARFERRRSHFAGWPGLFEGGAADSWRVSSSLRYQPTASLARGLADFYTRVRVRHFIGNGLALYASAGAVRAPMLDGRVVEAFRGLDLAVKRDECFHRTSIEALARDLDEIPYNTPVDGGRRVIGYSPFATVLGMDSVRAQILDCPKLDELISTAARESLLQQGNPACAELLLTLAFAGRVAAEGGL